MKLIIGLGNPGKKYEHTRHNAGFLMVDRVQYAYKFPEFKFDKHFNAEFSRMKSDLLNNEDVMLVKPQTFMNDSGTSARAILDFYKLSPNDIVIIHDDIDIEIGKWKVATDSRSAGHNGVQDMIDKLGTQKIRRIRVGIGKPEEEKGSCPLSRHDYVLGNFSGEELDKLLGEISGNILFEIKKFLQ